MPLPNKVPTLRCLTGGQWQFQRIYETARSPYYLLTDLSVNDNQWRELVFRTDWWATFAPDLKWVALEGDCRAEAR